MTAPPAGWMLGAYETAMRLATPFAPLLLRRRLRIGKEDATRLGERMGHAGQSRPAGSLVWLHGASVGESLAALPIVDRLVARGLPVLVTTGTVTSARIMAERLPAGALHQFVPLDVPAAVRRFLAAWRPDLCLLTESELWPTLILETSRASVPMVVVNGRLSARSFARWRRLPGVIRPLMGRIALCLAQSEADGERFAALGVPRVSAPGNLKFDAEPPPAEPAMLAKLQALVAGRPLWLAASTHADEEGLLLDVHHRLAAHRPDLLTIVVPRVAQRGPGIVAQAAALGLDARLRSRGQEPEPGTAVYVADTMGELGLFYRLAPTVFVGKSLGGGGGQNPIEPAKLGCAILHGPQVENFPDIYARFDRDGGALRVPDGAALSHQLGHLLDDPAEREALAAAAKRIAAEEAGVADRILTALGPWLPAGSRS